MDRVPETPSSEPVSTGAGAWTPGPWDVRPHHFDDWGFIRGPADEEGRNLRPIVAMARAGRHMTEEEYSRHRREGTDPYEANARLIAAAPDLYERLVNARNAIASLDQDALGEGGDVGGIAWPLRDELLSHIDAALAKARGESA